MGNSFFSYWHVHLLVALNKLGCIVFAVPWLCTGNPSKHTSEPLMMTQPRLTNLLQHHTFSLSTNSIVNTDPCNFMGPQTPFTRPHERVLTVAIVNFFIKNCYNNIYKQSSLTLKIHGVWGTSMAGTQNAHVLHLFCGVDHGLLLWERIPFTSGLFYKGS